MPTLKLVYSNRVVVRTSPLTPQTLWCAWQVVSSASCVKTRGRKIWPEGLAWLRWHRKTSWAECKTQSSRLRNYFVGFSQHESFVKDEHSGCAWSMHWTSAFVGKRCDLFVQHKITITESTSRPLAEMLRVWAFMAVRSSYTEQALSWESSVSCLSRDKSQT